MKSFQTPILPVQQTFVGEHNTLNLQAICAFAATGFFLDQDTYYKELKVLKPAHTYILDDAGETVIKEEPWFKWNYNPREISLNQAVSEFANLFEKIVSEQVGDRSVILPLSGGLDSRTQAAALRALDKKVHAYGYAFEGGHNETSYGQRIAKSCSFPFENWKVSSGYLWRSIEGLASMNKCYSEFTHPRQMAFIDQYVALGEVFSLGHWGDVLFDDMGVPDDLPLEQQVKVVFKKIVKKSGLELGSALWQAWGLSGDFQEFLIERVRTLLADINISNSANARIRAFKSLHWAPRWTAANLAIFQAARPVTIPYFDDEMCKFICTVPEKHLAGRQIQIEYIKRRNPALARIPWQQHRPFNLYTYKWNRPPFYWPYVTWTKIKQLINGKKLIQRNWELQFMGVENDYALRNTLFNNDAFKSWIPEKVTTEFYRKFAQQDPIHFSHSVSMLLTLAMSAKQYSTSE